MKLFDIILENISGDWGNESPQSTSDVEVKCLRSADIVPIYQFDYSGIPFRYVSQKSMEARILHEGDIVIEKSGGTNNCSTGRPIYISGELLENNEPLLCSNFCSAIRLKKDWNPRYVYYYLRLIHKEGLFFNFEGKTSGIHNLDMDAAFKAIDIPEISYPEQEQVAKILSSLDRKIALNRKINAELEQMAKELYDYWFVQFDFPNSEGKPYKSSGGKMVYYPQLKREIPEGWEVKSVLDSTDVLYGYPFSTEMFVEERTDKPVIRIRDIQDGTSSAFTTEEVDEKYRVEEGDVVLGMDGNFHCSIWHNNESFLNQRCVRFRAFEDTPYTPFSLYFSLQPYIEQKQRTIIGSTVGHLLDSDIREMYLLVPNIEWDTIKSTFLSLSKMYAENKKEITKLVALRDQLLPLLMNGQVTIK